MLRVYLFRYHEYDMCRSIPKCRPPFIVNESYSNRQNVYSVSKRVIGIIVVEIDKCYVRIECYTRFDQHLFRAYPHVDDFKKCFCGGIGHFTQLFIA